MSKALFLLSIIVIFAYVNVADLTPTAHINAKVGDFAKTVLMPGDPLRAKFIAETFLEDARLVNNVRGIQGYTGKYRGKPVSVMASGMGMPSIGIYSYELFNFFGVENIIRIGTIGSLSEKVNVRDIIVGTGAHTDSNFGAQYNLPGQVAPIASYKLLKRTDEIGRSLGLEKKIHFGSILSSDVFYNDNSNILDWQKLGTLGVEMEAAALYLNAARAGKHALTICTVSNNIVTGAETTAEERQYSFKEMMELALNVAISFE